MAKQDSSPLSDAAAAFDSELASYSRLGRLFVETPLSSLKTLERANTTLAEIAACEERLQAAGQALVKALSSARDQQELLAKDVVAHVPTLQARNQQLQNLMKELGAVAGEVAGLNDVIGQHKENGDATKSHTPAAARDVSETVLALSDRAERLAGTAREIDFEELATQAHALHQRLQVIGKKLQKAGGG
ncbi:MAG: hypothetical protein H0X17_21325 [Deltaproteobacteria bacterium]|nr:hypothetical protein [Deltaproteobacteria bacterium]